MNSRINYASKREALQAAIGNCEEMLSYPQASAVIIKMYATRLTALREELAAL